MDNSNDNIVCNSGRELPGRRGSRPHTNGEGRPSARHRSQFRDGRRLNNGHIRFAQDSHLTQQGATPLESVLAALTNH
jgi:hypothetical protein